MGWGEAHKDTETNIHSDRAKLNIREGDGVFSEILVIKTIFCLPGYCIVSRAGVAAIKK